MTQKTVFLFSGVLTAFLLVIGGGLVGHLAVPAPAAAAGAMAVPVAAVDPASQIVAQLQDREIAYQQLIDQANQRLKQAYDQQKATAAQINQSRSVAAAPRAQRPAAAAPAQPAAPMLSAETAINIGIDASHGKTMTRAPQLVLFEGKVAYEIGFTNGAIYVDANSGAVLYNGTTAPHASNGSTVASAPAQPPASGGEPEDEHDD